MAVRTIGSAWHAGTEYIMSIGGLVYIARGKEQGYQNYRKFLDHDGWPQHQNEAHLLVAVMGWHDLCKA
jgi:hypothetical protein